MSGWSSGRVAGAECSTSRPSAVGSNWTTRRSINSLFSCSSSEQTTPTATAAATGSARVAPKVTTSATFPVCAVFHTTPISPSRSDLNAAKMSTAPNVGMATMPTRPDSATRTTSIHSPANTDAQRLRAPADTFRAVDPTDPPTGVPRKSPEARLPTPCPMKSPLVCDGEPSGLGADSATPAPCTSAIAAMASAPEMTPMLRSEKCGRASGGRPVGMAP